MVGFEVLLTCLALNIYKEARGEPLIGQLAVAMVTINRAKQWENGDICKVVFAKSQFSWTITDTENGIVKRNKRPNKNNKSWNQAIRVAKYSLTTKDFTKGATHYHTIDVSPVWTKNMKYINKWGRHKFYKDLT